MNARQWVAVSAINAAATTTTGLSTYIDMATYATTQKRELKVVCALSNLTTTTTVTVSAQECDTTNGTYTDFASGAFSNVITTNGVSEAHFRNDKRYVKFTQTPNATGTYNLAVVMLPLKREANS